MANKTYNKVFAATLDYLLTTGAKGLTALGSHTNQKNLIVISSNDVSRLTTQKYGDSIPTGKSIEELYSKNRKSVLEYIAKHKIQHDQFHQVNDNLDLKVTEVASEGRSDGNFRVLGFHSNIGRLREKNHSFTTKDNFIFLANMVETQAMLAGEGINFESSEFDKPDPRAIDQYMLEITSEDDLYDEMLEIVLKNEPTKSGTPHINPEAIDEIIKKDIANKLKQQTSSNELFQYKLEKEFEKRKVLPNTFLLLRELSSDGEKIVTERILRNVAPRIVDTKGNYLCREDPYFIFRNKKHLLEQISPIWTPSKPLSARQIMLLDLALDPNVESVIAAGGAGTGKTTIMFNAALRTMLRAPGDPIKSPDRKIVLAKAKADDKLYQIGFVPGDEQAKLYSHLRSYQKVFEETNLEADYEDMLGNGHTKIKSKTLGKNAHLAKPASPLIIQEQLADIRGLTYLDVINIFDETQNATEEKIGTYLQRGGIGSRAFVMGDLEGQFDKKDATPEHNSFLKTVMLYRGDPFVGMMRLGMSYRNETAKKARFLR